ncbi:MAG TPA: hypothetical protein VJK02_23500 [Anaerolineales bacterium]|nr:hypothetical protein [Anaerolineales bacterium]
MCYNLCVVDECHIYRVTDVNEFATIQDFIREVDGYWTDVETDMGAQEDYPIDLGLAMAACMSGVIGLGTAIIGQRATDLPRWIDPRVLIIAGRVGAVAGVAACAFSVMSYLDDRQSSSDAAVEQIRHFNNALEYFNTLRETWDEAEVTP